MTDMLTRFVDAHPIVTVVVLCVLMVGVLLGALALLAYSIDTE